MTVLSLPPHSVPLPPSNDDSSSTSDGDDTGCSVIDSEVVPPKLSPGLAQKILRSFPRAGRSTEIPDPPKSAFEFQDEIIADVQSAVAYAFSSRSGGDGAQGANAKTRNPNLSLYCPYDDCNEIIDAMIDIVSHRESAEVLVLDSHELSLGGSGIFGKDMHHTLEMLYKEGNTQCSPQISPRPPRRRRVRSINTYGWGTSYSYNSQDPQIQAFFDAIVNLEPVIDEPQNGATKRRIIYLRDFGTIAEAAAPIMNYILRAIETRRTTPTLGETTSAPDGTILRSTILVMGFSEKPFSQDYGGYALKRAFNLGGRVLRSILPPVGNRSTAQSSNNNNTQYHFINPFTVHAFHAILSPFKPLPFYSSGIPPAVPYGAMSPAPANVLPDALLPEIQSQAACLCIAPKDVNTAEFKDLQLRLSRDREKYMWNTWIRVLLEHQGGTTGDDPLGSMQEVLPPDAPPPSNPGGIESLRQLSSRARTSLPDVVNSILLSALRLSASDTNDTTGPLVVSPVHLATAYKLHSKTCDIRTEWVETLVAKQNVPWGGTQYSDSVNEEIINANSDLDPVVEKVKASNLDNHERQLIHNVVDLKLLTTSFDDVCISPDVVETLRTIISLPLLHPEAFKTGILRAEAIGGVLLYGPPGTGKTMVCRALARECRARMLQVKPSDVMDKYVGETEKLVHAIFTLAHRLAPCVIFIDELDALFRTRRSSDDTWVRNMLNEFMQAMDGLQTARKNKDAGVVVIGATNRPYDLDDAIIRRLPTRMMIDLPDTNERERILRVHLAEETLHEDLSIPELAKQTLNYSGSDLRNLCVSAAMASVKEMIGDIQWDGRPNDKEPGLSSEPPNPETPTKQTPDWGSRVLNPTHFKHAFTEVRASTLGQSQVELHKWHRKWTQTR